MILLPKGAIKAQPLPPPPATAEGRFFSQNAALILSIFFYFFDRYQLWFLSQTPRKSIFFSKHAYKIEHILKLFWPVINSDCDPKSCYKSSKPPKRRFFLKTRLLYREFYDSYQLSPSFPPLPRIFSTSKVDFFLKKRLQYQAFFRLVWPITKCDFHPKIC